MTRFTAEKAIPAFAGMTAGWCAAVRCCSRLMLFEIDATRDW